MSTGKEAQCLGGIHSVWASSQFSPLSMLLSAAPSSYRLSPCEYQERSIQMVSLRGHKRREFSQKVKGLALRRCMRDGKPYCENCGVELNPRSGLIFEHLKPDALGGEPTLENCACYCKTCAAIKTETVDVPTIAKADRVARSHLGIKRRKGPPMPGSKASGLRKRMDGSVERR